MSNKELHTKLWGMANDLRGNTGMELTELKNYVLGIMFYKFISDKNEKFYMEELQGVNEDLDNIKKNKESYNDLLNESKEKLGYAIKIENLFSRIITQIQAGKYDNEMFARSLIDFNDSIESDEDFSNLFEDVRLDYTKLGNTEKEKSSVISKIIIHIQDIEAETGKFNSDILGDAYEYLISKFASNAGKKAGEFYTPQHVSQLLTEIVTEGREEVQDIYDPTVGSGSLLIRIASSLKKYKSLNGQEKVNTTYNLTRMNMIIHGVDFKKFSIKNGDTILNDKFPNKKFDIIVSNPPYGTKWDSPEELKNDDRFYSYGAIAPKGAMEMSFVQHMEYHLKPNGIASILLPVGVLFRTGAENKILKYLIEKNILDSVILLPSNMFASTTIPVILMTLKKNKEYNDIFLMDATDFCEKIGKKNIIGVEHRKKILSILKERKTTQISKNLNLDEIEENNYNLNITRYIQRVKEEIIDIDSLGASIKENLNKLFELEKNITRDIENIKKLL